MPLGRSDPFAQGSFGHGPPYAANRMGRLRGNIAECLCPLGRTALRGKDTRDDPLPVQGNGDMPVIGAVLNALFNGC